MPNSGAKRLTFYSLPVTIRTTRFNIQNFFTLITLYLCVLAWRSEQTKITFTLYVINRLVFITETERVYCAVRTGSLYNTDRSLLNPLKTKIKSCICSFGYFPGVRLWFADVSERSVRSIFKGVM
jgi:hypothetical protein